MFVRSQDERGIALKELKDGRLRCRMFRKLLSWGEPEKDVFLPLVFIKSPADNAILRDFREQA
jgi:hypothetical protein